MKKILWAISDFFNLLYTCWLWFLLIVFDKYASL